MNKNTKIIKSIFALSITNIVGTLKIKINRLNQYFLKDVLNKMCETTDRNIKLNKIGKYRKKNFGNNLINGIFNIISP